MKKSLKCFAITASLLLLVACAGSGSGDEGGSSSSATISEDGSSATIRFYKDNSYPSNGRYIPADRVNIDLTYTVLSGTLSNNENVFPSTGTPKLLVIPVHVAGGEAYKTDAVKTAIEKVFFGENDDDLGFKSVKEFYYDASFGKFDLQGEVTDWFDTTSFITDSSQITAGTSGTIMTEILPRAISWVESQGIDLKDYDYDENGSIDGIYLVYDHLDWTVENQLWWQDHPNGNSDDAPVANEALWNFTTWDWSTEPDPSAPTTSAFSWSSFDMIYTSYCELDENDRVVLDDLSSIPLDSHTFIHEFGHQLGLDDYYATDDSSYRPAGQMTMMDQNVGDLDSYSKMLLGWMTPYIVYGTSQITIKEATKDEHAVIVVPSNFEEISEEVEKANENGTIADFTYTFNPFSEYMMIDLYSPTGNNEPDAYNPINGREGMMTRTAVRMYHVDSRIFTVTIVESLLGTIMSYVTDELGNYVAWNGEYLEDNQAILMPISNSSTEYSSFQLPYSYDYFDQIRMIEATGINSFDRGNPATNYSLFTADSSPFDITTFGYQFFNANYSFNDGADLPFKIQVESIKEAN